MPLTNALPNQGSTNWYAHYSELHDAAVGRADGAIVIASTEAPASVRRKADIVAGTGADDDNDTINNAIDDAAALQARSGITGAQQRGTVLLTGGEFDMRGSGLMRTGVRLQGMGMLTVLRANAISTTEGYGTDRAVIKHADVDAHLWEICDMWIHGGGTDGGTNVHGICSDGGGTDNTASGYPDTNPDPDIMIHNIYMSEFQGGTRHGVLSKNDSRGCQVYNMNIRRGSGNAIEFTGSPDSHISNIHIGGWNGSGIVADGGNLKVCNVKAYYCDTWGFQFTNARFVAACVEAQDCVNGVLLGGAELICEAILIDTCQTVGLHIASSRVTASFAMLHRSGGRYPAGQATGILFDAGITGCNVRGSINGTGITTTRSGSPSATNNEIAVWTGSAMYRGG